MLKMKKKKAIIEKFRTHEKDTGSSEVQIAMLTQQIKELTSHLKKHKKDNHSRRGLLSMVAKRRAHLKYLEGRNKKRYDAVVKRLALKK